MSNFTNKTIDGNDIFAWKLPLSGKITLCIVYALIFVTGTIGNASVICTLGLKRRNYRTGGKGLIIALAVTDFFSSIAMPFVMFNDLVSDFRWHFGEFGCALFPAMNSMFLFASSWILVAISWERMRYEVFF